MTKITKKLILPALSAVAFAGVGFTLGNAGMVASAATECNHTYESEDVVATCTEQGYTRYICIECGDEKKDNYTEAIGHDYTETKVEATCTTAGYTLYSCNNCDFVYTETTEPAKGHT